MPQLPILSRTLLLMTLRDGTVRLMDYCLVNTTLGAMLEPRTLIQASGAMQNDEVYDSNFTDVLTLSGADLGTVGMQLHQYPQWPRKYNTL